MPRSRDSTTEEWCFGWWSNTSGGSDSAAPARAGECRLFTLGRGTRCVLGQAGSRTTPPPWATMSAPARPGPEQFRGQFAGLQRDRGRQARVLGFPAGGVVERRPAAAPAQLRKATGSSALLCRVAGRSPGTSPFHGAAPASTRLQHDELAGRSNACSTVAMGTDGSRPELLVPLAARRNSVLVEAEPDVEPVTSMRSHRRRPSALATERASALLVDGDALVALRQPAELSSSRRDAGGTAAEDRAAAGRLSGQRRSPAPPQDAGEPATMESKSSRLRRAGSTSTATPNSRRSVPRRARRSTARKSAGSNPPVRNWLAADVDATMAWSAAPCAVADARKLLQQ